MANIQQTIQNLLHNIPGYTGYSASERRREADKVLRSHLADQYRGERQELIRLTQDVVAAGRLAKAEPLDQIIQALDLFIARLETAPRGYAGWFAEVTIDETDLEQIYQFDARLASSVPLLHEQIVYSRSRFTTDEGFDEALDVLREFVDGLNRQFDARQEFLVAGKRPEQAAWPQGPQ